MEPTEPLPQPVTLLDYLEVVIHIFHRDKRAFYSLEDLWGDAPRITWEATASAH